MSRSVTHRSSDVQWNGKMLFTHNLGGRIVAANSTQKFGFNSPCDGTIVSFRVNITTAWTNAAAALSLGTEASATAFLASTDIHAVTASVVDYTPSLATAVVTKDQAIVFYATSGDTTGVLFPVIVIEPR